MSKFDADIVIIGYGPTGVTAANLLGMAGIKTIVLERHKDIFRRARAVTVNDWTMRLFQSLGLDETVKRDMDETIGLRWITYDGRLLNQIDFPVGEMGHARSYAIYQPLMEQSLRDGAARYAEHVTIRYGQDVSGIQQDEDGVNVTGTDTLTGEHTTVRARYALACDGGSSGMREELGIRLLGETVETKWVIIDAKVKRWWPERHLNTFWSDSKRPVVDIALSKGTHRWELPLEPHETEKDFETPDQLWRLINAMGVTRDDVELQQHAFYKHHVRQAEHWRAGRAFLLGDAAHLMPPWAGQGMQSGIRDAFNLCWKLVQVLRHKLPESLLETFERERAPDVARYTQISVGLGRIIKQALSPEEVAAMQPPPGSPPPLLAPPALAVGWLNGTAGPDSAVGKMIPQPRAARTTGMVDLLDKIIGNGFVLLGDHVDPAARLTTLQRAQWDSLDASYHAIRGTDQRSEAEGDIIDIEGTLIAWMRRYNVSVIAIRPDRFVAASDVDGLGVPA